MKQIDFHFHVGNRLLYACRFTGKVSRMGKSIAVWCPDEERLLEFNRRLWTYDDLSFIPHAIVGTSDSEDAPVKLSANTAELPSSDVLLVLGDTVPADYETLFLRFDRIVDIVGPTEEETAEARNRYRIYHQKAFPLKAYDQSVKS